MKHGTMRIFQFIALSFLVVTMTTACEGNSSLFLPDGDNMRLFTPQISEVVVEVDYEEGARPYTEGGTVPLATDPWEIFRDNANHLFDVSTPSLDIHDTEEEMEALGVLDEENYTSTEILAIAEEHRDQTTSSEGSTATFYVLFLDGYFEKSGEANENVIGVAMVESGVIAMFKPVIDSIGSTDMTKARAEQATLVHEFGHAVGLVESRPPFIQPQSDHKDEEHGSHCTNEDCAMHWTYENPGELATFIGEIFDSSNNILFGDQCIEDVRAVSSDE